ncbi:MAG: serine dehydratase subunit alpha family protein [Promethearchaeota archaeon]|nr:MAG: serine dehydratase subunit alpha family protein [Candidatus Lokiarchaeota archaeon]
MDLLNFLKNNVVAATGCTEPIAVAYAVSLAYHALFQDQITIDMNNNFKFTKEVPSIKLDNLKMIKIEVDQNVYKNAYNAIIPGTDGLKGIEVAAALALYLNPKDKLNIFNNIEKPNLERIQKILNDKIIKVSYIEEPVDKNLLKIYVTLQYMHHEKLRKSKVKVHEKHDNVVEIKVDGKNLYNSSKDHIDAQRNQLSLNLKEILKLVEIANGSILEEVNKGILMNLKIADEGLNNQYGLNIAKSLKLLFDEEGCSFSIISEIRTKVAAAGDARMGGSNLPVMTSSGSGNMGITAIIPVVIMGKRKDIPINKIQRAVLLSHIITSIADNYHGHLSLLCGAAIKAGFGVAAAIAYLLDGSYSQIHNAINLMAANNVGFLCDGAKPGCALKVSTAAGIATECALMALENNTINSDNGIIFENPDDTLKGIGNICQAMDPLNKKIIKLLEKSDRN